MKYDEEYNSYKFSDSEFNVIVKALDFYSQYSPLLEMDERDYISHLVSDLKKNQGCYN